MKSSSTLASATATLLLVLSNTPTTLAQDAPQTTLTLPFYGYDTQSIDASILAVSASRTTLSLACPPGTDQNDCGLFPSQTLTIGPSIYNMFMGADSGFTGTVDCTTYGITSAVCAESAGGDEANFLGSSTATYESGDIVVLGVRVTGGMGLLASTTGTAEATTTGEIISGSSSIGASVTGGSGVSETSARATGNSASASSTATAVSGTASAGAAVVNVRVTGSAIGVVGVAAGLLEFLL